MICAQTLVSLFTPGAPMPARVGFPRGIRAGCFAQLLFTQNTLVTSKAFIFQIPVD